jgi:hypothetical protein
MESEFRNSNACTKNEPRRDPNSLNAQPWLDEHRIKVDIVGAARPAAPLLPHSLAAHGQR